jgi:hypothetical protein
LISGRVFNDKNSNGEREKGEGNIKDWVISLYKRVQKEILEEENIEEENTEEQSPEYTFEFVKQVTSTNKGFIFDNVSEGVYKICQETKTGWTQTKPTETPCNDKSFGYEIELSAGQVKTGYDFGDFKLGKITGIVFEDKNYNKIKDKGEKGIADIEIYLKNKNGDVLKSVISQKTGRYIFEGLSYGDYVVSSAKIDGFVQTVPETDYSLSIISRKVFTKKHFGFYKDLTAPEVPTLVSPKDALETKTASINLSWNPVSDISLPVSYIYQYATTTATTTNNAFVSPLFTSEKITTSFGVFSSLIDDLYYFKARACDNLNNCSQKRSLNTCGGLGHRFTEQQDAVAVQKNIDRTPHIVTDCQIKAIGFTLHHTVDGCCEISGGWDQIRANFKAQLLVASVRDTKTVHDAAVLGAHIATVPFKILKELFNHPLTDAGIEKFLTDWKTVKNT